MLQRPCRHATAIFFATLVSGGWLAAPPARAQDGPTVLNKRLWLQLAAFRPDAQSTVRVDDQVLGIQGSNIQLERDLGVPRRKTVGALLLGARLDERWRSELEYFALDRKVDQYRIDHSYRVEDTTYEASALVDTEFDSEVTRLSVGYSLWRMPDSEFGLVVGAHVTRFRFSIAGQGSAAGVPVSLQRNTSSATVPLPTVGLYGTYAFSPTWVVNARTDYFSLKHGDYDGRLLNIQTNLFYRFNPNLSAGLGYRYDDYKVGVQRGDLSAQVEFRFRGPQILIDAGF